MMKLMMLELKHQNGTIYPVLISSGNQLVLVDTGFPGQFEELKLAVEKAGFEISQLTAVVITHQDIDHIGTIKEVIAANPGVKIYLHTMEAPYVTGVRVPVKVAKMEAMLPELSEEQKGFFYGFKKAFEDRQLEDVILVSDKEWLEPVPEVQIIHTPGHTPGHICLYIPEEGLLIAGDALNVANGKLTGASPQHTQDMDQAYESIAKLVLLDLKQVICYHGGLVVGDIKEQLLAISRAGV